MQATAVHSILLVTRGFRRFTLGGYREEARSWEETSQRSRNKHSAREVDFVSIIRVGLSETKNFAEGYEAIFGKKKQAESKATKTVAKNAAAKKKKKTGKKK